jgi:hypothetical protein
MIAALLLVILFPVAILLGAAIKPTQNIVIIVSMWSVGMIYFPPPFSLSSSFFFSSLSSPPPFLSSPSP